LALRVSDYLDQAAEIEKPAAQNSEKRKKLISAAGAETRNGGT
jgi:hypothetical protein